MPGIDLLLNFSDVNFDELFKNLSSTLPESEQDRLHPTTFQIATKAIFYALSFLVAVLGNVLIVFTVVRTPGLKTRFNVYMVNMAVSDLLVAFCCMWPHFVASINEFWVLGAFMCRFYPFFQVTSVSSMILTLVTTVVDRFSSVVCKPLMVVTQRCQPAVIGVIWISSCLVSLPWPIYLKQTDMPFLGKSHTMCMTFFPSVTSQRVYITVFVTTLFFVPIVVLSLLFLITVQRLWMTQEASRVPGDVTMTSSPYDTRRQAVWMTGAVLLVMAVFWSPQMGLLLWEAHRETPKPRGVATFKYIALYLAYSSSAINPLVYISFNKHLRSAVWRCIACKPQRPESVLTVSPATHRGSGSSTPQTATVQSSENVSGQIGIPLTSNTSHKQTDTVQSVEESSGQTLQQSLDSASYQITTTGSLEKTAVQMTTSKSGSTEVQTVVHSSVSAAQQTVMLQS